MDDTTSCDMSEEEYHKEEEVDNDGGQSEFTAVFLSAVKGISNAGNIS
jgi:hypothetical protein